MTDEHEHDGEEPEEELFPAGSLDGDDVTRRTMFKNGLPTKVEASIGKAAVPVKTGLLDPNKAGRSLVSWRFKKNEEVPEFKGGDGADRFDIVGLTIRQHLTATYVEPANDEAALVRQEFAALCALDARRAAELHAELASVLERELTQA